MPVLTRPPKTTPPTEAPPPSAIERRWRRWSVVVGPLLVILGATAIFLDVPGMLFALRFTNAESLTRVEASREPEGMAYAVTLPDAAEPRLVDLGPAPTPISVSLTVGDDAATHLFLYETSGAMTLVSVDRSTGVTSERSVPNAQLTYAARFDRRDPGVLWIATCLAGGVVRFDTRTGDLDRVLTLEDDTHVFCLDQADDGSLYVGTHPSARLLHVRENEGQFEAKEVPVPTDVRGERTYLHGLFVAEDALLLHYGCPGRLVRLDQKTEEAKVLYDSASAFLAVRSDADHAVFGAGDQHFGFDRTSRAVDPSVAIAEPPTVDVTDGIARIDGEPPVEVSLFPRHDGMRITALGRGPDGAVYGGTYWNSWLFRVDVAGRRVEGVGPLPAASGQFHTTGTLGETLVLPNYQGDVYRVRPGSPPEKCADVPQAHYGIATASKGERIVVGTYPNYDQPGGMLYSVDAAGRTVTGPPCEAGTAINALAFVGPRLLGGTIRRFGMGLADHDVPTTRPEILELDPRTLRTLSRTPIGWKGDIVTGLVPLGTGEFLCASNRRLYHGRLEDDTVEVAAVPSFTHLGRACGIWIDGLIPYDDETVLLLAEDRLLAYRRARNGVVHVARLPGTSDCHALDGAGNLVLSKDARLSVLRADTLRDLLETAGVR